MLKNLAVSLKGTIFAVQKSNKQQQVSKMKTFEEFKKEIDEAAESLNNNKLKGAEYRSFRHGVWMVKAYELYRELNEVKDLMEKHFSNE